MQQEGKSGGCCGCLGSAVSMLLAVAMCAGILGGLQYFGMSSQPYALATEMIREHPEARQALGSGIEPGFLRTGEAKVSGASGAAQFSFGVSGSKGSGVADVMALKDQGKWAVKSLELTVDGREIEVKPLVELPF